jgi:uncharacterized protein YdiU (UPF0061 family)
MYGLQHNMVMNETSSSMAELPSDWQWQNRFRQLGDDFYAPIAPQPLPNPYTIAFSSSAAQLVGLSDALLASKAWQHVLAGNTIAPGSQPLASVYSGHQFGQWAGQLGDGRAVLLGEIEPMHGEESLPQEIQLKGAGLTPFSRMGDGRAVLRSSIREFLCSEAMHGLGVPTTRALSIMGSDYAVYREQTETAAVVARVAPSFVRFGHFEHFSALNQPVQLKKLADYAMQRYYPACQAAPGNPYASLLQAVTERTAQMVAQWQAIGFCHGVMNTDNMSILGLTIDYGPFQFLDAFDPGHICNHSDHQGRYAFNKQPDVAYWNLFCLGQALMPLIGEPALAIAALETYKTTYPQAFAVCMTSKLGFTNSQDLAPPLVDDLLALMAVDRVDYTIFWRRLSHWAKERDTADESVRDVFVDRTGIDRWLLQYSERIAHIECAQTADLMLKTNPKFVLRNHLGEMAIQAAKNKDFSVLANLQGVLEQPFSEHPQHESFANFPPDWAGSIAISCSS